MSRFPTQAAAAHYLAAMIDGEGTVVYRKGTRLVLVANTDPELIRAVSDAAAHLGLAHRIRGRTRKPPYKSIENVVFGGRAVLEMLARIVPIQAPAKKALLRVAVTSYVESKRPPDAELRDKYVAGWTQNALGRLYGVDSVTIHTWLKSLGVEIRSAMPCYRSPGEATLRKNYEEDQLSLSEMAVKFSTSQGSILRWLRVAQIPTRSISEGKRIAWRKAKARNGLQASA